MAPEYKLKAALIYKLTHFVEWPDRSSLTSTNKNISNRYKENFFNICVLGDNPFGDILEPLRQRHVEGLPIQIYYFLQSEDVGRSCQLLFISDSKRAFVKTILTTFSQRPTLSLSDIPGFAALGGMIEMTQGNKTIGFTINPDEAKAAGLSIAAPLLELANITDTRHGP